MSNKSRLQQNNTDLQSIKTIAEGLPVLPTVTIDGTAVSGNLALKKESTSIHVSNMPYYSQFQRAVVFNGEIHVMGGGSSSSDKNTNHYKFDGSSWTSVSTLPVTLYRGSAVVLNGEIHIMGGDSNLTSHHKWNGSSWTSVSTLPYSFADSSAVVLNNEIHIFGSSDGRNSTNHYKWNGSSWTSVSTLPISIGSTNYGGVVLLDGQLHLVASTNHYKWSGSAWTSVSTLPYNLRSNGVAILDNEIHILGGSNLTTEAYNHYKWNGISWIRFGNLPIRYGFNYGDVFIYDNAICYFSMGSQQTILALMGWTNIYRKAS